MAVKKKVHVVSPATATEIKKSLGITKKDEEIAKLTKEALDSVREVTKVKKEYTIEDQANYLSILLSNYTNWRSELPMWMSKRCKKQLDSLDKNMIRIKKVSDRLFDF